MKIRIAPRAKTAALLGGLTAFFASVAAMALVDLCQAVSVLSGTEPTAMFRSPLVAAAGAFVEFGIPFLAAGYVAARVGKRVAFQSVLLIGLMCLVMGGAVDLAVDLVEFRWEEFATPELRWLASPAAMVVMGAMIALPVNIASGRRIEKWLVPALLWSWTLLVAGAIYAIGMWAALNCGPFAGIGSIGAMAVALAATVVQTAPGRRHRQALVLMTAGWSLPVLVTAYGVAIGFEFREAMLLVFFQTVAVLYGYRWMFRLFPEDFRPENAPFWIRRRPGMVAVPREETP